ncbi:LIM/homeobox protein Lhx2 [Tupaia chinensis]|uniref:LIM/homeobox protein Lhx2 n=1 Tax=Tupaia chinensis TaxID=246437 RepID=L9JD60_TUPCH|nr:LIM/homeobox protein Lhx2 [Tupaia chinensis]
MLFHSLSGPEVHGVIDEMDRRAKSEAPAISSSIDRGDTETTMPSISSDRAALCAGCGGKISDRYYLLAVDKQWHMRCLKCCECKLNLESELTCFSKDGSIYCKEDYYRRFSVQRCARCHLGISASEMVMRARDLVYHLNCFTCTTCNKMLTTGDHFGMKDSLVYCRLHFEALLQGEYRPRVLGWAQQEPTRWVCPTTMAWALCRRGDRGSARAQAPGPIWRPTTLGAQPRRPLAKSVALGDSPAEERRRFITGRWVKGGIGVWEVVRKFTCCLCVASPALSCNENDAEHLDRDQPYPSSQKTKRMRTSFKHHQLRTMKSYFAINHNPDAKDLKQLAQKTGLTKRVLQVWFQNARAKFRRNLLRQENTGVDKSTDAALQTGTPSGPASELSNASLSPSSTPTTLTDLTSPTLPTVTSVLTSVPGNLEGHEPHSPSQTTLTNLF